MPHEKARGIGCGLFGRTVLVLSHFSPRAGGSALACIRGGFGEGRCIGRVFANRHIAIMISDIRIGDRNAGFVKSL